MKTLFKYSPKIELDMIDYFTKCSLQNINFVLPKKNQAHDEINQTYLKDKVTSIEFGWRKIEKRFFNQVNKLKLQYSDRYTCYLSRYGCSGFYLPPDEIVIRIANDLDLKESNINIAHELMHLILKENKKTENCEYVQIEKMVDEYLMRENFKDLLPGLIKQDF